MDEYLFSKETDNLKQVLSKISLSNKIISIQMTIFFPATFESKGSVIEKNILRKSYDSNRHPKCLFNLDLLNKVSIHGFTTDKKIHVTADNTLLCINHYRYNSFEYLYGIKEGRGGGTHKNKYKTTHNRQNMTLIKSLNDTFLSNDTYLRDKSFDLIKLCKKTKIKPNVELYPESSWIYLKNNQKDIYEKYCDYNKDDKILTIEQIYEINLHLNEIVQMFGRRQ
jgi:hypothetical protein